MVESRELYDILELDPRCSSSDIKKAYRKMAMQHHPDKNPGASHEKFQAIQGAYEILSDPDQRETYDQYGLSGINGGGGMDGQAFDVHDLFASMFGGHAGFGFSHHSHSHSHGGHKQQKKARGDDQIVEFNVTLEDAFTGKETTVELEKDIVCTSCKGVGGKKGVKARKCGGCSGKGIVMIERMVGPGMVAMSQTECPDCKGEGETFKSQDKCKKCKGKKTVKSKNRVGVYIEKGARDGDKVVLRREGEQYPDQKPGDVILILNVEDHDTFTLDKKNNNLFTEITITLSEALLGFDRLLLTHLDGRGIRVNQPAPGQPGYKVFSTGDVVKVQGEGFPKRKSTIRGDLFLKITVTMPTKEEMEGLASKHLAYQSATSEASRCYESSSDRRSGDPAEECLSRTNPNGETRMTMKTVLRTATVRAHLLTMVLMVRLNRNAHTNKQVLLSVFRRLLPIVPHLFSASQA